MPRIVAIPEEIDRKLTELESIQYGSERESVRLEAIRVYIKCLLELSKLGGPALAIRTVAEKRDFIRGARAALQRAEDALAAEEASVN